MTILNVWISPERALIGVDTKVVHSLDTQPNSKLYESSKMVPMVHANAIIAGRGHIDFQGIVFSICRVSCLNFEGMEEKMADILAHGMELFGPKITDGSLHSNDQQIALVGWSPSRGRMVGHIYSNERGKPGFVMQEISPWIILPGECFKAYPPVTDSPAAMELVAREQMLYARATHQNAGFGGRLLVAEITRDSMTITARCDLET